MKFEHPCQLSLTRTVVVHGWRFDKHLHSEIIIYIATTEISASFLWCSVLRLFIVCTAGVTYAYVSFTCAYISFSLPSHAVPQTQWVLPATPVVQTRPLPQSMNATLTFRCMLTTETFRPLRVLRMLKTVVSQNAQKAKPLQNFRSIIFWILYLIEGSVVTISIVVFLGFELC